MNYFRIQQVHKQMSLLMNEQVIAPAETEERVIYVAYDVDDAQEPAYHILDPEQVLSYSSSSSSAY
jgi:hypothetical protein